MKKILLILFLLPTVGNAKTGIILEAGAGAGNVSTGYKSKASPLVGVVFTKSFKILEFGIGVRYWGVSYSDSQIWRGVNAEYLGTIPYDATISNLSIPISVGLNIPVKKFDIIGKIILAPTFLLNHNYDFSSTSNSLDIEPGTEGYFTSAGIDAGLGYRITSNISLGVKYSGLMSLNSLKYEPVQSDFSPYYQAPNGERQFTNSVLVFVKLSFNGR